MLQLLLLSVAISWASIGGPLLVHGMFATGPGGPGRKMGMGAHSFLANFFPRVQTDPPHPFPDVLVLGRDPYLQASLNQQEFSEIELFPEFVEAVSKTKAVLFVDGGDGSKDPAWTKAPTVVPRMRGTGSDEGASEEEGGITNYVGPVMAPGTDHSYWGVKGYLLFAGDAPTVLPAGGLADCGRLDGGANGVPQPDWSKKFRAITMLDITSIVMEDWKFVRETFIPLTVHSLAEGGTAYLRFSSEEVGEWSEEQQKQDGDLNLKVVVRKVVEILEGSGFEVDHLSGKGGSQVPRPGYPLHVRSRWGEHDDSVEVTKVWDDDTESSRFLITVSSLK